MIGKVIAWIIGISTCAQPQFIFFGAAAVSVGIAMFNRRSFRTEGRRQRGRYVRYERKYGMDFYERIGLVMKAIPSGRVATYGQIALLCGKPKNARQVGYALNRVRTGEKVPAHRVVNARGILSGAASFDTPHSQMELLKAEGVEVLREEGVYRVDLKRYIWKNTIEDAMRLSAAFGDSLKS